MSWRNERSSVQRSRDTIHCMRALMRLSVLVRQLLLAFVVWAGLAAGRTECRAAPAPIEKPAAASASNTASKTSPPSASAATGAKPPAEAKATPMKPAVPPSAPPPARPPGAAPATAKAPVAEPGAPGPVDAATYVVRLRDLESRVDELKEQIRRSHTRLSLLSDTILSGGVGGAEADIVFRNEMSNAFRVVSVLFVLDGAVMKKEQDDTGELAARRMIPVYDGTLTPGDHTLQVVVVFQGHGYGVFSYLRAHKYTTKHTHSFTVKEGKLARIEATAYEKGGVTTPIDQRPNVRFTEKIVGSLDDAPSGAE